MDQASFESNLQNGLFTEYFNCFLALPIFSRTIQYNRNTKEFEEVDLIREGQTEKTYELQDAFQVDSIIPHSVTHSHAPSICGDNYISTLERSKAIEWISQERLPPFLKSDIYSEYKLANLVTSEEIARCKLPSAQPSESRNCVAVSDEFEGGVNFQVLASKKEMAGLKKFLMNTKGENDYLFWIECERLGTYKQGDSELSVGLREIKEKYVRPGAKCELAKGRWGQRSQPVSLDDMFHLQNRVLNSLVNYWCPRYLMRACRRVTKSSKTNKRSRPATHQGRGSILTESQMSALKCESQALRETASPLILPQLSSTPNPSAQAPTARSFSVIASINKLPYICENSRLSESVSIPKSPSNTFTAEMQRRKRSKSVPLPKIFLPVKEEKFHQQLTRCLAIEHRKAGGVFQRFIEKVGNEQWRSCLLCWREIQNFKAGFLTEDFNPFQVETRAKTIFSKYVLSSGDMWVRCPHETADKISRSIYPAFDDLFDSLEEHTLQALTEPWKDCVSREHELFEQIPKSDDGAALYQWEKFEDDDEFSEELEVASEVAVETKEKSPEPSESGEEVEVEIEEEADKTKVVVGKDTPLGYTFQQVIQDNTMLNLFKSFLDSRHASVDIMFWMEVESFRRIPVKENNLRNAKAKLIRSQYLTKNYYFSVNSPASKEAQHRMVTLGGGKFGQKLSQRPPTPVLVEGQKQVQAKLEHRWLPVFVKTREFLRYAFPGQDQKKMSLQASMPNQEEWKSKVFESRWMTNSRDIINCRKALLNPITCKPFETFIELKSSKDEHLKNDLNFWLEIQRFKELWHVHTPRAVLQLKIDVIVNCFLQSKVPPKIQVDLTQELVEKLMRKVMGPYLFREAQADMFRVLFSYWMEYHTFKDQHKGDDIEIAFMELRQQVHERELARLRRQKEFERKRSAHMRPFGIGQIHLPGEEDHTPDLIFRLSDVEGDGNGISTRKKVRDPMPSPLTKIMTAQ